VKPLYIDLDLLGEETTKHHLSALSDNCARSMAYEHISDDGKNALDGYEVVQWHTTT